MKDTTRAMFDLVLSNVEIDGQPGLHVGLIDGRIAEIGDNRLRGREEIDGKGGALIPGLADQHIHLLSLAAQSESLRVDEQPHALAQHISDAVSKLGSHAWLRVTGYHESTCGPLDRTTLDRLVPNNPVRVQHQSGAYWLLNRQALERVLEPGKWPECVERSADGNPTGLIWRGDAWLDSRLKRTPPSLRAIGRQMASFGITSVTDASVTNDARSAQHFIEEIRTGALPQRLMLMSGGELSAAPEYRVGPVKILLNDSSLPDIETMISQIEAARGWNRAVAVHCVTTAELALTLAAFTAAGSRKGDRIEHGGIISPEAIEQVALLGLTVVTQSSFVFERGDRYLRDVAEEDVSSLYRAASLIKSGIGLAGSSDAPYSTVDPWAAMRSAVRRVTRKDVPLGMGESLSPKQALNIYLKDVCAPGGEPRHIKVNTEADLCLLAAPLRDALANLSADTVAATIIGGRIVYQTN